MADTSDTPNMLTEAEPDLTTWMLTNGVALVVGLVTFTIIAFTGYYVTTNGYEVTGGIMVVCSIMLASHFADLGRRLLLKRMGLL